MNAFRYFAIVGTVLLWSAWLAAALHAKGIHPAREVLDRWGRLGVAGKIIVALFAVHLAIYGSTKPSGTNGTDQVMVTNDVEVAGGDTNGVWGIVLNAPQPMFNGAAFLGGYGSLGTTGPTVAVRPYRLESVSTNEGCSYAMPADGTVRGTWHLTGAYEDVQKVVFDGFAFPLGSDLCTSLWAYTWGKVRPQLKNVSNEIAAVGAPMSAIPDVSRFWTAATSNDTYLLTWENFAAGRLPAPRSEGAAGTVNAQIELFRNGDFITRSNDVESVYRRVIEPNPIADPINPPDPDDPSRPLYPYGPVQDLSVIEETNAYCWVDIVVNAADAWVRFEGDGASNLADPSFAAKAGETNHVVILIGKTYKVMCDMPFTVVGKSDPSIDEWWEDSNTLWLNWPVNIWSWGDDEGGPLLMLLRAGNGTGNGNGFTMYVSPSGLGGEFSWTNSCCAVYGGGLHFSYGCDGFCLCGGCSARGYYGYEGYRIECSGGSCGCSWYDDDDRHGEDDPDDPEPTPGVSVSFSKSAVIFEDAYTNMPGEVVQWQSTTTKLTLEAHGGMKGGTATFTFTNKDKLIGPDIPTSITVPAGHCKTYEFTYRGNLPSGSEEDITVHGEFHENNPEEGGLPLTSDDELTSVKVVLEADENAPDSEASNFRHKYGVFEQVNFRHYPSTASVSWSFSAEAYYISVAEGHFFCTPRGDHGTAEVSSGGVTYVSNFDIVEPQVVATNARANASTDVSPVNGEAGHLLLCLDVYVTPFYVSFKGLNIQEVPDESQSGLHDGYYDDRSKGGPWSHVAGEHTAGQWNEVNAAGYFGMDRAGRASRYDPPWVQGSKTWSIPMAWSPEPDDRFMQMFSPNPTSQHFSISSNGTFRIEKFNHWAERPIHGSILVDGIPID